MLRMGDNTPEQLIKEYKRALAHAKGERYAKETRVEYENGWFRVQHVDGSEKSYRKRQLVFFTEALGEETLDPEAYDKAKRERQQQEASQPAPVAFDAKAYNQAVAERIAAAERAKSTGRPQPGFQPHAKPAQTSFAGCLTSLLLLAFSVGVFWWIHADRQERKRTAEAAREATARVRREEQEKSYREAAASLPSRRKFDSDPVYTTTLGKELRPGMKLYYETSHQFYGYVKGTEWGYVEVVLAETVSVSSSRVSGYSVRLKRSYVTDNLVIKRSEL